MDNEKYRPTEIKDLYKRARAKISEKVEKQIFICDKSGDYLLLNNNVVSLL
jgi:hypothetical protein